MTDQEPINSWELGFDLFKREPELLGVEVWRRAVTTVTALPDQFDFVTGYMTGRLQRDAYEREQREADPRGA